MISPVSSLPSIATAVDNTTRAPARINSDAANDGRMFTEETTFMKPASSPRTPATPARPVTSSPKERSDNCLTANDKSNTAAARATIPAATEKKFVIPPADRILPIMFKLTSSPANAPARPIKPTDKSSGSIDDRTTRDATRATTAAAIAMIVPTFTAPWRTTRPLARLANILSNASAIVLELSDATIRY